MTHQQLANSAYFADCVGAAGLTPASLSSATVAAFAAAVNEQESFIPTIHQVVVCGKEQCAAEATRR